MTEKKKHAGGRPPKVICEDVVRALARVQCSYKEIASECGCDAKTIESRFRDIIEAERDWGKNSLRKKQFDVAMAGSVPMLTWLGRCWLGQKDYEASTLKDIKELIVNVHASRLPESK